jgi:hypothetical protein
MNEMLMTEAQFLEELRRKFRTEGYQELDPAAISRELDGYQPDLVVQQGDEVLVIECKSEVSPRTDAQLRRLKELVERHPDWRFRFMVVPRRPPAPPDEDDIENVAARLGKARELAESDTPVAAMLLWAVLETLLRHLLTFRQERPSFRTPGMRMARQLRDLGELDDEELELLEAGMRARNLAVHGYRVPPEYKPPQALYDLASGLLARIQPSKAGSL